MKSPTKPKTYIYIFAFLVFILGLYIQHNVKKWHWLGVHKFDIVGYYSYLPSIFIHKDLATFESREARAQHFQFYAGVERYGLYYQEKTGKYSNKYPIGIAILQTPSFFISHYLASISKKYEPDGYSVPYQKGTAFSNLLFAVLGLIFLFKLLVLYFEPIVAYLALTIIFFGTNLYYYSVFEPGMSHVYLFFIYSLCLWSTSQFYHKPNIGRAVMIGMCIGLAIICRPTDILLVLFPIFWPIADSSITRIGFFSKHKWKILLAVVASFPLIMLQLSYWKYSTGSYLFYSYEEEGFNFLKPAIIKGLFSYQKGWFIYTPLALLGFIGALLWSTTKKGNFAAMKSYLWAFGLYFLFAFHILFSWWLWYYGGSFGARIFVQSYAIMALPIAFLINWLFSNFKNKAGLTLIGLAVAFFIFLNTFQSYQYQRGIIHHEKMSKPYYWRVFLKLEVTDEDRSLLRND